MGKIFTTSKLTKIQFSDNTDVFITSIISSILLVPFIFELSLSANGYNVFSTNIESFSATVLQGHLLLHALDYQLFFYLRVFFTLSLNLGLASVSSLSKELLFIWCSTFSMQLLVSKTTNLGPYFCTRITLSSHDFISFKASFSSLLRLFRVLFILLGLKSSFSILLINNSMLYFVIGLDL